MNGDLNSLLKSLGPQDPEWLKMSQKVWTQLDEMAQNDPNAYKEYIEKARKDAQNSRLVKPGWGIKTFINNGTKVLINLGASERISPPPSFDLNDVSVPLILGTPRTFENTKVLDIVYHSSVINKTFENSEYFSAILDLSWGACKEILNWDINTRTGLDTKKEEYYGRYGWDDQGKPVSDTLDTNEIIYKESDTDHDSLNFKDSGAKDLIQEIKIEKKEPMYKIIDDHERVKVLVYLPDINTGSEADVQLNDPCVTVETDTNYLKVDISGIKKVLSAEFSFRIKFTEMIDDAECDICGSAHSPTVNPIMFCDGLGCDVPVHQKCYNVESIPDGPWYCKRCADKVPIYATSVVCCQQKNGALLRTGGQREYIHSVCAYWNSKISKHTENFIKVDPRLFARKGCTICGMTTGLTVSCSHPGCSREFHVTCALDTKTLERTLKDFCNPEKLKCPKHFAVIMKDRIKKSEIPIYEENNYHKNGANKTRPIVCNEIEKVVITDVTLDRLSKRNSFDRNDRVERKMFKPEPGGTFEWLAEKITSIQKAIDDIGHLSPQFKAEIDRLKFPNISEIPIKRYSLANNSDKEKEDYQDLQRKYISAQEEINNLRKEVGSIKDSQQSEMKKSESLKQSLFRLLKFFDLPDHIKLQAPSDVENALSILCKELD